MISVSEKHNTLRKAIATSSVHVKPESIVRLKANDLPKQDVLAIARATGVMAAKRTPELIPYCHPIPIDAVEIRYDIEPDHIRVTATVTAIWKTGVEMEALTAASVTALTIYDMLKPVDKTIEIRSTKLLKKRGGKSDYREKVPDHFTSAVIVTSDSAHRGVRKDRSGEIIRERLQQFGFSPEYIVLPDDRDRIVDTINSLVQKNTHLVITTGGTGLGPRDITVEATATVITREIPGIMEAARSHGQQRTPYAMLSRGIAGQNGNTIIVNLPGSSKGAKESLDAIFPAILHAFAMIDGDGHD